MDIEEFLKTGTIHYLRLGLGLEELLVHYPDVEILDGIDENVQMATCFGIEITLLNHCIYGIVISIPKFEALGLQLTLSNNQKIQTHIPMETLVSIFERLGISWYFSSELTLVKQIAMKTVGGVELIFDFSDGSSRLCKIGAWQR